MTDDATLAHAVADAAIPLRGTPADFDALLDRIGDARLVLLGEATHGSHELYGLRAEITKRLIREKGFGAIAVEADWPDARRIDHYIRQGRGEGPIDALADFQRFPQWMWRNTDIVELVGWLRVYNDALGEPRERISFHGLDLYSMHSSMQAVVSYLELRDPDAAQRARDRYACFDEVGKDPRRYGYRVAVGMAPDCEREVLHQLLDVLERRGALLRHDGAIAEDRQFEAEQNARVVAHAEEYYRLMFESGVSTWNLRDTHMADTLDVLTAHLERHGRPAKTIVWAHNSHCGDSAAMAHRTERDEITIGHLCRERHGRDAVLVGFTTDHGTVTAASDWGGDAERKQIRPALAGSYEAVFHATGLPGFVLVDLHDLREPRLERAIGVVYRPETERESHYFTVRLGDQFDAVIHVDETHALEPLERSARWDRGELPETYPTGL